MNIKIIATAEVSTGTDLNLLRQRIADQLRQIANPVREDQGITVVSHVIVGDDVQERGRLLHDEKLRNLSESIQADLVCLLDGHDEKLIDNACQIVVDKVNGLILQLSFEKTKG